MVLIIGLVLLTLVVSAHLYVHKLPRSIWAFLLSLYYRDIHFNLDIPDDDIATIVVANHPNAFIDPFALQIALDKPLVRTIRADWLEHWLVKWLIRLIGAVPLARFNKDKHHKNRHSFAQLNNALSTGKWVVVFPEGISHNRPTLHTFKKGAAHLADQYMRATGQPIRILQLGLYYSDKSQIGSDIWVNNAASTVYQPDTGITDLAGESNRWRQNIQQTLPGRMRTHEKRKLNWVNNCLDVVTHGSKTGFENTASWLEDSRISLLHNWLNVSGLDIKVLIRHPESRSLILRLFAEFNILISGLPLALLGLIANAPAAILHYIATRQQSKAEDKWASNTYVIGLPLYPLYWLVISCFAGPLVALICLLAGIYSLFYWRTWESRKRALFTTFSCLSQPNAQKTVVQWTRDTLGPLINWQQSV